jgi:hypothetical protein
MKNTVALLIVLSASFPSLAAGTAAKWFRLTIKEKYAIKSEAGKLRMAELQFYDWFRRVEAFRTLDEPKAPCARCD